MCLAVTFVSLKTNVKYVWKDITLTPKCSVPTVKTSLTAEDVTPEHNTVFSANLDILQVKMEPVNIAHKL